MSSLGFGSENRLNIDKRNSVLDSYQSVHNKLSIYETSGFGFGLMIKNYRFWSKNV